MNRLYRKLPDLIQAILLISEGWLIGSSVKQALKDEQIGDYDIIVPSRELYQIACKMIADSSNPKTTIINSFGGMKFIYENGLDIDIWCEELDHFIKTANKLEYCYNMKRNILLKNES